MSEILSAFGYNNTYLIIVMLGMFAVLAFCVAGMWTIFKKAGYPGWACLIPFYGTTVFLKIIGKPMWWILLMGVPLCGGLTFFWYANVMLSITFAVGNILYVNDLTILIVIGLYCCSFIWQIWALNMLSKSFGRDEGITAGLFCLPVVFIPVIAFDRRVKYLGPYGDPELFRAYSAEDAGFDFEKDKFNA